MVTVRKVHAPQGTPYARRFLIERRWPRNYRGTALRFEGWLKDLAPSQELGDWFREDPGKWEEFRRRYFAELDVRPEAWCTLLEAAQHGTLELLHNSGDANLNNAVALKEYLEEKLARLPQPA